MLWQVLLEHFYSRFTVYLVDDVAFGAGHLTLTPDRDTAVAYSPTSLCLTREQRVGDPTGDDFVVAVLIGRLPHTEIVVSTPTPHWEEPLAREGFVEPCKHVIKVAHCNAEVTAPIREDEQANGLRRKVGEQIVGYLLPNGTRVILEIPRYSVVPPHLVRGDRRNNHRETGFIGVVSIHRALCRATCEGCTSCSLPDRSHQGALIVADSGEHDDYLRLDNARLLKCLLGGLTTRNVGIVMAAHADSGLGCHEYTSYISGIS